MSTINAELLSAIARVRRSILRNPDVHAICDALEHSIIAPSPVAATCAECGERKSNIVAARKTNIADEEWRKTNAAGFDRKAYQRDYMKKRRGAKVKV